MVLFYVLPPIPPRFLEHGGAENPAEEERLDRRLAGRQRAWIANAKTAAARSLERVRAGLREAGVAVGRAVTFSEPRDREGLADQVVEAARARGVETIVVGADVAAPSDGLARALRRRARGFAVHVVA